MNTGIMAGSIPSRVREWPLVLAITNRELRNWNYEIRITESALL